VRSPTVDKAYLKYQRVETLKPQKLESLFTK